MTAHCPPPSIDFLARLRKIDAAQLKARDVLVLWAIAREAGMMGREIAMRLGYPSRSHVQLSFDRLIACNFIEDRRAVKNQMTPNDLHILPSGEAFLSEIVPV